MSLAAMGTLASGSETALLGEALSVALKTSLRVADNILKLVQRFPSSHAERMSKYSQTLRLTRILLSQLRELTDDRPSTLSNRYLELVPNVQTLLASLQRFENVLTKALLLFESSTSLTRGMSSFLPIMRTMNLLDRLHLTINTDLQAIMRSAARTLTERSNDATIEWRLGGALQDLSPDELVLSLPLDSLSPNSSPSSSAKTSPRTPPSTSPLTSSSTPSTASISSSSSSSSSSASSSSLVVPPPSNPTPDRKKKKNSFPSSKKSRKGSQNGGGVPESLEKTAPKLPSIRASLHLHLKGILTSPDGLCFWEKSFGIETLSISWPIFLGALTNALKAPITTKAEALLRCLIDPVDEAAVSIFKFSDFLLSFGPLNDSLRNAQTLFDTPYFHGFLSLNSARFLLLNQPPGTFLVRFAEFNIAQFAIDYVSAAGKLSHCSVDGNSYSSFSLTEVDTTTATTTPSSITTTTTTTTTTPMSSGTTPLAAQGSKAGSKPSIFRSEARVGTIADLVALNGGLLKLPFRSKLPVMQEWFFSTECTEELNAELQHKRRGTYGVCFSTTPGDLTLIYSAQKGATTRLSIRVTPTAFFLPSLQPNGSSQPSNNCDTLSELLATIESLCSGLSTQRQLTTGDSCSKIFHMADNFDLRLTAPPSSPPAAFDSSERVDPLVQYIMEGGKKTVIARIADMFTRSSKATLDHEEEEALRSQTQALVDHIFSTVKMLNTPPEKR